jgi:hypothetical protein
MPFTPCVAIPVPNREPLAPLVIVGGISVLLFTFLVMLASFITTFFMSSFEEPSYWGFWGVVTPYDVAHDLITAAYRVIKDGDTYGLFEDNSDFPLDGPVDIPVPRRSGLIWRFVRRFLLGLPVVGAGSVVHMLLSAPFLGPVHWLARYRGSRRRNNSRDIAAIIVVGLLVVGIARWVVIFLFFIRNMDGRRTGLCTKYTNLPSV